MEATAFACLISCAAASLAVLALGAAALPRCLVSASKEGLGAAERATEPAHRASWLLVAVRHPLSPRGAAASFVLERALVRAQAAFALHPFEAFALCCCWAGLLPASQRPRLPLTRTSPARPGRSSAAADPDVGQTQRACTHALAVRAAARPLLATLPSAAPVGQ